MSRLMVRVICKRAIEILERKEPYQFEAFEDLMGIFMNPPFAEAGDIEGTWFSSRVNVSTVLYSFVFTVIFYYYNLQNE